MFATMKSFLVLSTLLAISGALPAPCSDSAPGNGGGTTVTVSVPGDGNGGGWGHHSHSAGGPGQTVSVTVGVPIPTIATPTVPIGTPTVTESWGTQPTPTTPVATSWGGSPTTLPSPGGPGNGGGNGAGSGGNGHGNGNGDGYTCKSGPVQCCNSVQPASQLSSANKGLIAGLLGAGVLELVLQNLNIPVGIQCNPISVIGAGSGANCNSQAVCCDHVSQNGLINVGCTPINIQL